MFHSWLSHLSLANSVVWIKMIFQVHCAFHKLADTEVQYLNCFIFCKLADSLLAVQKQNQESALKYANHNAGCFPLTYMYMYMYATTRGYAVHVVTLSMYKSKRCNNFVSFTIILHVQ